MTTTTDLILFAHQIERLAENVRKVEKITSRGQDNPVYQMVTAIAEQLLPIYKALSPIDTGMLRSAHIIGDTTLSGSGTHITATAEIIIDPTIGPNPKWGGYPREYGPEYHRERRAWFDQAYAQAQPVMDIVVDQQFSLFVHTISL